MFYLLTSAYMKACEIGFYGKNCSDRCTPGLYGYACSKLCRNCSQANCHHIFGCPSGILLNE